MTENLPKGLITTTGEISSEIHGLDPVDIEQIAQLWKGMIECLTMDGFLTMLTFIVMISVFSENNSLLQTDFAVLQFADADRA